MTRSSTGRIPVGPVPARRRNAARRMSMIIGLALAAVAAAAMYLTLFRQQGPAGQHAAAHQVITLRRLATFAVAGVPGSVQLDPRGQIVVVVAGNTVAGNTGVSAWSTSSWRPLSSFGTLPDGTPAGSRYLTSPVFSPDGKEFSVIDFAGSGEVADVWDVATGHATPVPLPVISSTDSPFYAAPGPNGLIAASYRGGTLGLATMPAGLPTALLTVNRAAGSGYQIGEPTFSPDGRTLAVGDSLGMLSLINVPGKRLVVALTAEKMYNTESDPNGLSSLDIDSITFSPDSKRVACGSESGIIRIWDSATGRNVSTFNVNGSPSGNAAARPVKTLVFSPDGKTLVTADNADSTLAVWDAASGRKVATLNAGTGSVASAAFTANGTLIVATANGNSSAHRIEIWATRQSLATNS